MPSRKNMVLIDGLTPLEAAFVDNYALTLNATEAYRRYNPNASNASSAAAKLMNKDHVRQAIEKKLRARREHTDIDEAWVLEKTRTVVERCMQEVPVLDKDGTPTGEFKFDSLGALRGLQMIGEHMAMWKGRGSDRNSELTDDELWRQIRALETALAPAPTTH